MATAQWGRAAADRSTEHAEESRTDVEELQLTYSLSTDFLPTPPCAIPTLTRNHHGSTGQAKVFCRQESFQFKKQSKKMKQLPQARTTKTWQEGRGTVPAGFGTDTTY